jgi:hypothetical protein
VFQLKVGGKAAGRAVTVKRIYCPIGLPGPGGIVGSELCIVWRGVEFSAEFFAMSGKRLTRPRFRANVQQKRD